MLVDSHCHLPSIDLSGFAPDMAAVLRLASDAGVRQMLSVCLDLKGFPELCALARQFPEVLISLGIHPNETSESEPDANMLATLAATSPSCIAIGETGLDYYRTEGQAARNQQQVRFRAHIGAALATGKPLIIHMREASDDTLGILRESGAAAIGGVMHCFAETWEVAKKALDLGFYISFSGIVTFKNAVALQDVARKVPADRMLIETDSPYLAPVPFRGKQNHPALVRYVAGQLASLRETGFEDIAKTTTRNFYACFRLPVPPWVQP